MKEIKINRYVIIMIMCIGSSALYFLPYLRWTFYDSLLAAVNLSTSQFAATLSIYGLSSMIFYAPGGYLADKFSPKRLLSIAFLLTGLLGFWYATYPSFVIQMVIFFLWGAIATAFFWSSMLKIAKSLGDSTEQGRMFGVLEGSRGLLDMCIAFVFLFFFSKVANEIAGITGILIGDSILCLVASVLVWIFISDHVTGSIGEIKIRDIGRVLKMPSVWILSLVVLSCYSIYITSTYLTPYMTEMLKLSASVAAGLAIVRSYFFMFVGGPIGGFVADKTGSIPRVIIVCFIIIIVALTGFVVLPASPDVAVLAIILMLLCIAGVCGMRGIYFAPLDQCKVPHHLSGTAIGVISVIGFTPDIFMNTIAGTLLENYPGADGYRYLFIVSLALAAMGFVAAFVLNQHVKKLHKTDKTKFQEAEPS
jgi:predicted MFS family arabinose efflux permease